MEVEEDYSSLMKKFKDKKLIPCTPEEKAKYMLPLQQKVMLSYRRPKLLNISLTKLSQENEHLKEIVIAKRRYLQELESDPLLVRPFTLPTYLSLPPQTQFIASWLKKEAADRKLVVPCTSMKGNILGQVMRPPILFDSHSMKKLSQENAHLKEVVLAKRTKLQELESDPLLVHPFTPLIYPPQQHSISRWEKLEDVKPASRYSMNKLGEKNAHLKEVVSAIKRKLTDSRTPFSSLSMSTNEPVVSVYWLHAKLKEPHIKVLDASWYMPDEHRNPLQEYQVAHIPGALFFDVGQISAQAGKLPLMLPSEEAFSAATSALGIENKDVVVVYDGKGIFSAARVWWMFRAFGHDRVWVLDGGLPRWQASGFDVESSASWDAILRASVASEAVQKVYSGQAIGPITFQTKFHAHLVWSLDQVKKNIEVKTHQHIDARSKPRYDGDAAELQKGIRSGHVPGSKCILFSQMLDESQILLPTDELKKQFDEEGISLDGPVVVSSGTGVTACVIALGLHRLGKTDVAVYDGSWTEWGPHPDTPVATSS